MPERNSIVLGLSGIEYVALAGELCGMPRRQAMRRAHETLSYLGMEDARYRRLEQYSVGMTERAHRPLGSYSKEMRQRIKLAQALIHDPDLLVLDKPLNGVDPVGRLDMIRLFRELATRGKAILISSHHLDEMDTLANRILFVCRGRILASGSLEEIRAMLDEYPMKLRITATRARQLATGLLALDTVQAVELNGADELFLQVRRANEFFASLAELVTREGIDIERLQVIDASTEAVFDYLMESVKHP